MKGELAQYNEMLSFAQFGSDLDAATKKVIDKGARLTELLKQPQYSPMAMEDMVISLFSAKHGLMGQVAVEDVANYESFIIRYMHSNHEEIVNEIRDKEVLTEQLEERLKEALQDALVQYKLLKGE